MTTVSPASGARVEHDEIHLALPAHTRYLGVLRLTVAGIAARLDYSLDGVEDLKLAAHEAALLLIEAARTRSGLQLDLDLGPESVAVSLTAPVTGPLNRQGYGWAVLEALVTDLHADEDGGEATIQFVFTPS